MNSVRRATEAEFDPSGDILAKTLDGRPAFWVAIVTREPGISNLPEELVALGEPRGQHEGRSTAMALRPRPYSATLTDSTWAWRRDDNDIVLLRHGLESARLPGSGAQLHPIPYWAQVSAFGQWRTGTASPAHPPDWTTIFTSVATALNAVLVLSLIRVTRRYVDETTSIAGAIRTTAE